MHAATRAHTQKKSHFPFFPRMKSVMRKPLRPHCGHGPSSEEREGQREDRRGKRMKKGGAG